VVTDLTDATNATNATDNDDEGRRSERSTERRRPHDDEQTTNERTNDERTTNERRQRQRSSVSVTHSLLTFHGFRGNSTARQRHFAHFIAIPI